MAFTNVTVNEINKVNEGMTAATYADMATALASNGESSATIGACFEMKERDDKYLLLFVNTDSNSQSFTIKASNALQGVNDYTCTLAAGKFTAMSIDSGRFKWVSANDGYVDLAKTIPHNISTSGFTEKGKVFVTATDAKVKMAVFKLPN